MRNGGFWAGAFVFALSPAIMGHVAQAYTLTDTYIGGACVAPCTDIVGSSANFQVRGLDVSRVKDGANYDLKVVVDTNYNPAKTSPSGGALGTGFGSLFFGSNSNLGNVNIIGGASGIGDSWSADNDRFDYVFSIPTQSTYTGNPPSTLTTAGGITTGNGVGTLYQIKNTSDVQTSFYPSTGTTTDTGGLTFRTNQAVGYNGPANQAQLTGTWTFSSDPNNVANQILTFLIENENGLLGSEFLIAWAMTCANDVILGKVLVGLPPPPGGGGQVPLPAGFILMGTILLGATGVARFRRRRG